MTHETTKILEAIRECCPALIGGLQPQQKIRRGKGWPVDTVVTMHVDFKTNKFDVLLCREGMNITFDLKGLPRKEIEEWQIIGHPPELHHLLKILGDLDIGIVGDTFVKLTFDNWSTLNISYDLTQTLTENLETNQQLREFVYQLVVKK